MATLNTALMARKQGGKGRRHAIAAVFAGDHPLYIGGIARHDVAR